MECGCAASYMGPSLANTCGGGSFVLFMTLLDTFIRNRCDLSEVCSRVRPRIRPNLEYDFVVIGSGSGGSVAAGRLAEEKGWRVLLLEAGGEEPAGSQVPAMVVNYFGHPEMDWGYKTEPEPVACKENDEKRCEWIRGKVLGGCSVLNGMMYIRGTQRDFDNWAAAGNTGWSYNEVLPYFMKSEDNQEIGSLVDGKYHGEGGPLTTSRFPHQPELAEDILMAAQQVGYEVSEDLNGDRFTGFAITQTNNRNGTRVSSARAFVRPHRDNPNFHVMLNSTATKIMVEDLGGGRKRATGVKFVYNNKEYLVKVKNEVIVAGGAVNSPQLLMLSGVGPKEDLEKVGIKQVHNLPGVGKNLQNHVTFYLSFLMKKRKNFNDLDWANALEYILNREGPMSSTGMSQVTARLNSKFADPSGNNPDLQLFFGGYSANCASSGEVKALADPDNPTSPKHFTISPVVLHPKSVGYLTLRSSDPLDAPLIYGNYLTEPEDVATLVEGIRVSQRLAAAPRLKAKYGVEIDVESYGNCAEIHGYDTDDFWQCAVKYSTGPENHQAGTCKMGPSSDPKAVVNPELLVHGIDNIRVMDASIMPNLVSGNTAATVMMIAEKGVDMIKNKWLPNVTNRGSYDENQINNHKFLSKPFQFANNKSPYQQQQSEIIYRTAKFL
ncbi:PREDICTED: glucose dehydrogenase [FAD, quinone]-like [Nicrophorus vespilloides]|uniref:Glucose dehydrogenase [FAD, quinone]-like n=1 Tax=Nicrophorus vespilloides TaxID=110193 RepID=A0ABM1ML62_NICVS|nr:PREDICTED: glucose dehydrogenase [FAD, quinone]-like [Nicrophorus vespilloides]